VTIIRLRKPFLVNLNFSPYMPFVWVTQTTFESYTKPSRYDSSFDFTIPNLNEDSVLIESVFIDSEAYELVASEALCISTEKSFYFDQPNQLLYVHMDHQKRFPASGFDSQKVDGYSSDQVFYDSNNIYYGPYLRSNTSITKSSDRQVYSKISFDSNTAELDNSDGTFDQFIDTPTPGADANILFISSKDLKNGVRVATPIYTGFSNGDNPTLDSYAISLRDKRSQLSRKVPSEKFNVSDFPDIKFDLLGDPIPEGYGDIIGAPAYCTNGTITSGNVEYKFATDATSISTIYVKTDDAWNSVTPVSTDASNGEFVLSATDARDSSGNPKQVKVDARFKDIEYPGEIIKDLLLRYYGILYNSENFNISQWESETSLLKSIYLYMGTSKDLFEYIEEIQNGTNYGFRFDVDPDGKFTIKVDDLYREISATYQAICNISDSTPMERDFEDFATSIIVKYNKDQESGTSANYESTLYQSSAYNTYRYYKERQYQSNLTNSTDAQEKADRIALDYSVARLNLSISLDTIVNHDIYDIIQIDTREYIDGNVVREYAGDRIIKISSITFDFSNEATEITGIDITDIRG